VCTSRLACHRQRPFRSYPASAITRLCTRRTIAGQSHTGLAPDVPTVYGPARNHRHGLLLCATPYYGLPSPSAMDRNPGAHPRRPTRPTEKTRGPCCRETPHPAGAPPQRRRDQNRRRRCPPFPQLLGQRRKRATTAVLNDRVDAHLAAYPELVAITATLLAHSEQPDELKKAGPGGLLRCINGQTRRTRTDATPIEQWLDQQRHSAAARRAISKQMQRSD
jgi:hypothetical protein